MISYSTKVIDDSYQKSCILEETGFTNDQFQHLLNVVSPCLHDKKVGLNRYTKSAQLVIILYYLKHNSSIGEIADYFSLTYKQVQLTLSKTLCCVSKFLYSYSIEKSDYSEKYILATHFIQTRNYGKKKVISFLKRHMSLQKRDVFHLGQL